MGLPTSGLFRYDNGVLEYRKLRVWNEAVALAKIVYTETADLPRSEAFGVLSQARLAALSISSNIAEGAGRGTSRDFARFLAIARGSCNELESLFVVGHELGLFDHRATTTVTTSTSTVRKMLVGLIKHARNESG